MNINDLAITLFDFSTYIVMYDKRNKKTAFKSALWDRKSNQSLFVELICNDAGDLTIDVTASLQSILDKGYMNDANHRNDYDFSGGTIGDNAGFCLFSTNSPQAEVVVGVGDIRNFTAKYHKYILNNGIVITATNDDKVSIYFKNGFSNNQMV